MKDTIPEVPVEEVPEVAYYTAAKERLRAFRAANPAFFEHLDGLILDYNDALQQASKVTRARGIKCGDFDLYQFSRKYDANYVLNRFGRDRFLELGGKISQVETYSVDRNTLTAHIESGTIAPEDVEQIVHKTPVFHSPKPIEFPKL